MSVDILEILAGIFENHHDDIVLCGGMGVFALSYHATTKVAPVQTEDADIILEKRKRYQKTLANPDKETLSVSLKKAGFVATPYSFPIGDEELPCEKWEKDSAEFYIEFLVDDHQKKRMKLSGVIAQGLTYFSMSLESTVLVHLPSGRSIRVASPQARILHKACTFRMRADSGNKKYKDLYYICYLSNELFSNHQEMITCVEALDVHDGWKKRGLSSLAGVSASIGEYAELIARQDEAGKLNVKNVAKVFSAFEQAFKTKYPGYD